MGQKVNPHGLRAVSYTHLEQDMDPFVHPYGLRVELLLHPNQGITDKKFLKR